MKQILPPSLTGAGRRSGMASCFVLLLAILNVPTDVHAQSCTPGEPTYYKQIGSGGSSLVSLEAELYTSKLASRRNGHGPEVTWTIFQDPNASNAAYINVPTVNEDALDANDLGADVNYDINFTTVGTYTMWLRHISEDNDAREVHVLLDGAVVADQAKTPDGFTEWRWSKMAFTISITTAGTHRLTIRHGEDGLKMDKIVLSRNATLNPTGYGPEATAIRTYAPNAASTDDVTYHVDHHTGHGFAVVEAEHPTYKMYGIGNLACLNWTEHIYAQASNDSISQVNTTGRTATPATVWGAPRIEFEIATDRVETMYLYVRHRGTAGNSSINVRVNNGTNHFFDLANTSGDYVWESIPLGSVTPDASGNFLLSILMNEDGTPIDKFIVSSDASYSPTGKGPLETILNTDDLIYYQENSTGYPVELPMEAPSQNLGGFYGFSGMQWSNVEEPQATGGWFATVEDPLTGWIEATGISTNLAPTMEFEIDFIATGTHYVYTRHNTQSDLRNSFAYYLDGAKVGDHEIPVSDPNQWLFAPQAPTMEVATTGRHTFAVAMQESGSRFDHMVISQEPAGSALVLPVELTSFSARAEGSVNDLRWITSREESTREHVIERSESGSGAWITVGTLSGAGDSDAERRYTLSDVNPPAKAFYRLRTVDFDGSVNLSGIVSVDREPNEVQINVYPDPTTERASLSIEVARAEDITVRIFTLSGNLEAARQVNIRAGGDEVNLPVDRLAAGIYVVTTSIQGQLYTRQFVKR